VAGRKKSGTFVGARHTGTRAIDPDNFAREKKAAEGHNAQEMWRLAVAFRLQEYADARVVHKRMEAHHQTAWLKKVRLTQKHNVQLLPHTICSGYADDLERFGLPPL
jgi:hypothetical protein